MEKDGWIDRVVKSNLTTFRSLRMKKRRERLKCCGEGWVVKKKGVLKRKGGDNWWKAKMQRNKKMGWKIRERLEKKGQ